MIVWAAITAIVLAWLFARWCGVSETVSFWLDMMLIYFIFLPGLFWFVTVSPL